MDHLETSVDRSVVGEEENGTDATDETSHQFRTNPFLLAQAATIGMISGCVVAYFKLSVDFLRRSLYWSRIMSIQHHPIWLALIPAVGGLAVGLLAIPGPFSPGLKGTVKEVDDESNEYALLSSSLSLSPSSTAAVNGTIESNAERLTYRPARFVRKGAAAIFTLGSGCSLGPEGPAVELGMNLARFCMHVFPLGNNQDVSRSKLLQRNRLLLSCGAAAGVSAGFNAPLAGVFFALEIVQGALSAANRESAALGAATSETSSSSSASGDSLIAGSATMTAILLASVLSALVCKAILGDHLVLILSEYSLKTPLMELPLYLLLGAMCGLVAFAFSQTAKLSHAFFDGKLGPKWLRHSVGLVPDVIKPMLGGLFCGVVGLAFPQILFFGYETLNSLLANSKLQTSLMLSLLGMKMLATAVSVGSGLVGGTFAPSLFLGAMMGGTFHNTMTAALEVLLRLAPTVQATELADVPAYAMIGAACVLAALFRAPLTGSLVLFELTRDYDVILPLMASAGVACVVCDLIESKFERIQRKLKLHQEQDSVSWGDLSDRGVLLKKSKRRDSPRHQSASSRPTRQAEARRSQS